MQSVFITGANRGIGLGFVEYYLNNGWQVFASCRKAKHTRALEEQFSKHNENLCILQLNLKEEESIALCAKQLKRLDAKLDLVINNAGNANDQKFGEWTQAAFLDTYTINAVGPALLIQALFKLLTPKAKIIQISSGLASNAVNVNPQGPFEAYSMSKAAINILSSRLADKHQDLGLLFCALSPGWVQTDMGGPDATSTVEAAVSTMATTIDSLTEKQNGGFLDFDGTQMKW